MLVPLLLPAASAYELTGEAWPDDAFPVEVYWTGTLPGWTEAELQAAIEGAAAAWTGALPCGFSVVAVADPDADTKFRWEDAVAVLFGDPNDELPDGVLASRYYGSSTGESFSRNGRTFTAATPTETIVNDMTTWATDADIEAGTCADQLSLQAVLTQEIGHVLGLADACEMGEPCTDADAIDATMYWNIEACSTDASRLGFDDWEGLAAVYGPACAEWTGDPDAGDGTGGDDTAGPGDTAAEDEDDGDTTADDAAGNADAAEDGGCGGCTSTGLSAPGAALLGAAALLLRRRRRT